MACTVGYVKDWRWAELGVKHQAKQKAAPGQFHSGELLNLEERLIGEVDRGHGILSTSFSHKRHGRHGERHGSDKHR